MRTRTNLRTAEACVAVLCAVVSVTGCSFDPLNYMSRNACEFFNCDELFFIEDILPLSAGPTGDGDGGEAEDEDGGHAH